MIRSEVCFDAAGGLGPKYKENLGRQPSRCEGMWQSLLTLPGMKNFEGCERVLCAVCDQSSASARKDVDHAYRDPAPLIPGFP